MKSKEVGTNTREMIIQTDGINVHIEKCELNQLEVCEICRRLIKRLGGNES